MHTLCLVGMVHRPNRQFSLPKIGFKTIKEKKLISGPMEAHQCIPQNAWSTCGLLWSAIKHIHSSYLPPLIVGLHSVAIVQATAHMFAKLGTGQQAAGN